MVSRPEPVLVVATRNPHKVEEMEPVLRPVLTALQVTLRPLGAGGGPGGDLEPGSLAAEDRATFSGNAALKALTAAAATGKVSLGEDSGLEVDALGGEPGVRSARYGGGGAEERNRLLLERLRGVPEERRTARFRAAVALKVPGGPLYLAHGEAEGWIAEQPRGSGGFGYDPVFVSRDLGRCFAEVAPEEKRRVSHRSRALRTLRGYLFEVWDIVRWRRLLGQAGCPEQLWQHQLAVARAAREMALLLVEAGEKVDPALVWGAALVHDVGRVWWPPGRVQTPVGVTEHAWRSSLWARRQGLDARLARAVRLHGLDSLASEVQRPRSWEERLVSLADKMVELDYVGFERRLSDLERRYSGIGELVRQARPVLGRLCDEVSAAAGLTRDELERSVRSCLEVKVFPDGAGPDDVERSAPI